MMRVGKNSSSSKMRRNDMGRGKWESWIEWSKDHSSNNRIKMMMIMKLKRAAIMNQWNEPSLPFIVHSLFFFFFSFIDQITWWGCPCPLCVMLLSRPLVLSGIILQYSPFLFLLIFFNLCYFILFYLFLFTLFFQMLLVLSFCLYKGDSPRE